MGKHVVILGVFLQGYHLLSNQGITMERNRRILIMVALPLFFLSAILVATSGGWEIGEADTHTSEVGPTLVGTVEKVTDNEGKIYLVATYEHDGLYYQLKFFISGENAIYKQYEKNSTTGKNEFKPVKFCTDSNLSTKSDRQDICLALPGSIEFGDKTYTVQYDGILIMKSDSAIKTVVFDGNPNLVSNNTKPTLSRTSVTKVVFLGSPTFSTDYVLTKTVKNPDNIASCITPLQNVVFKSHIEAVPSTLIFKGNNETHGELNISFESSVGEIPLSMNAFTIFSGAASDSKLTYSFGANSSKPVKIIASDYSSWMNVSLVIDVNSSYWNDYIAHGELAGSYIVGKESADSLVNFIKDGRLKVCGNPTHAITGTVSEGGAISFPERASFRQTVTVIPSPEEGYILGTLEITCGGKTSTIVGPSYSFEMPDADVSISATFIKVIPLVVKATSSGSEVSMDISVSGKQNGVSPASISAYVKYEGNATGDRFVRMNVPIINYSGQFETELVASMSAFTPVECLIQIFSDSGDLLTQKVVAVESR